MEETRREEIPVGGFSSWLDGTRLAQKTDRGASVPCGECNACCKSSYFIHIRPDEAETLARIPKKLLFPAPGLPKGNVLLGYDEHGCCPMLIEDKCSIYAHRPQTCRNYDCRVFPATGLPSGDEKPLISRQMGRWKFDLSTPQDRTHFSAVQSAARFIRVYAEFFPAGFVPNNATQQAMVAIKVYEVFLGAAKVSENGEPKAPISEIVGEMVAAYKRFETGKDFKSGAD